MIAKVLYTPLLLFLLAASPAQRNAILIAESNNQDSVILSWEVENEQDITKYWLERRIHNTRFKKVEGLEDECGEVIKGGKYECMDSNFFNNKSIGDQVYTYRLYAELENGDSELLDQKEVSHTTNAVRRTWGNIKSMFQ
ncbi:MAG: hypothetical protein WD491_05935 [Balneolales bacterium]